MNELNIKLAKNAYYKYIEKEENIENEILTYIVDRINANKDIIIKLINITKEDIDLCRINKCFTEKEGKYKSSKKIKVDGNNFVKGVLITQKGVVLKEVSEVEKVIETCVEAILSRNSVVISDKEYFEVSVKNLVLEIIYEALKKFGVDKNLIQLLPYEEVNDVEFNNYCENGKTYIYLEDDAYKNELYSGELVDGELDEVIEKINNNGICECAVIYTNNKEKAYKFINLVNGKNVFVNASVSNIESGILIDDLYIYKNVIYPVPK